MANRTDRCSACWCSAEKRCFTHQKPSASASAISAGEFITRSLALSGGKSAVFVVISTDSAFLVPPVIIAFVSTTEGILVSATPNSGFQTLELPSWHLAGQLLARQVHLVANNALGLVKTTHASANTPSKCTCKWYNRSHCRLRRSAPQKSRRKITVGSPRRKQV